MNTISNHELRAVLNEMLDDKKTVINSAHRLVITLWLAGDSEKAIEMLGEDAHVERSDR